MFITRSGWYSRIRAATWEASSASTWAVVMTVLVLPSKSAFTASHLDLVREAMQISVKTSLHWQHLRMATLATPPQPMMRTLLMENNSFLI